MRNVVRRWLSSALVAAVAASVLGAVSPVPSRASGDPGAGAAPAQMPDDGSALAAAARSGTRVEVVGRRSETTQVFANPGGTLTLEQHTSPVRVRRGGGSWAAVDTRLSRGTDGVATPAATVVDMRFPAGGLGSSVWMSTSGRELALGLPWLLPAPELAGSRAAYRAVLPGVDLVLTARPDGFSEVLVVHSREAAANPALRTLRFGLSTTGLRLRGEGGGFVAEDPSGAVVFTSAAPLMWDSAGGPTREVDWPVHGDQVAPMKTSLSGEEFAVEPDRTLLDDPAAVFPVFLDPMVSGSRNEWAMISSGYPAQAYHNFGGDQGVGLCDVQDDGTCARDQIKRIAWEFGISSAVHGTRVLKATFAAYETAAYNCTAREVQLWRVGALSSGTTWNNHAGTWGRYLSTVDIARDPDCANKPAFVEFDATAGAQEFSTNRWPGLTLGLRATNEGTMSLGWKRFRNDATLSVTYNSAPSPPANPDTAGKGCASGAAAPFVGDSTPTLTARVSDPDGDVDLIAEFAWDRWNTSLNGWERVAHVQKTNLASGTTAVLTLGVDAGTGGPLEHGRRYRWTVLVIDPFPGGSDVSGWMDPWCEFEIDTVKPDGAPGVSSPVYVQDGNYHGSIGLTADFTFQPTGVLRDVTGYLWGWADPPTTLAAAPALGAALTLPLTPPPPDADKPTVFGQLTLYVRSVDRAGNAGPRKDYNFLIDSASDPVGRWELADAAGSTSLVDSSGNSHPATAASVTLGTAGRLLSGPGQAAPTVASFNGSASYASTGTPIMDTSKSFTVAAWVRPDVNSNGWRAIVAATGGQNSSFFLRRDPDNKVHFTLVSTTTWTQAVSTSTTRVGVWTHLVGVYDAAARKAHLYVNGVREGTTDVPEVYNASGALEIGRSWWAGSWAYHPNWHGAMADVTVWDRVLVEAEAAPMAATLVGSWRLDGHGGDDTAWGRSVTPTDVSWVANRAGVTSRAGAFNGTTSQAATAGPAMRTDQSFTVVAWVRADGNGNGYRSVVAANGAWHSAFFLRRDPSNRWHFTWVANDSDPATSGGVVGTSATTVGVWTHVAAVYDAQTRQARLYVNSQLEASGAVTGIFAAGGPLMIGHDRWVGNPNFHNPWHGAIDDVRVYAGALPDSLVDDLYRL